MFTFNSFYLDRGSFCAEYSNSQIKNETMFFNADLDFCYKNGGEITKNFINSLPDDWTSCNPVIDSRVHMLMPGFSPCIGGYHHDDIARNNISGQPDYKNMKYKSEHLMGLVNGEICPTQFAIGQHSLPEISEGIVYREWNKLVENQVNKGILKLEEIKSGRLIEFNWESMHRGQPALADGWRWFIRISRKTDRQKSISNEIRKQVQVYLDPAAGW